MRLNRGTILLIAISFLLMIGALIFIQAPAPSRTVAPTSAAQRGYVFDTSIGLADVTRWVVSETATELRTSFERDPRGEWRMLDSADAGIGTLNQAVLEQTLVALLRLEYTDQFAPLGDLAGYGLLPPSYHVDIETETQRISLGLGRLNPERTRYYATLNDASDSIYLVTDVAQINTIVRVALTPPLLAEATPTSVPVLSLPGYVFAQANAAQFQRFELRDALTNRFMVLERDANGIWQLRDGTFDVGMALDQQRVTLSLEVFSFLQALDGLETTRLEPLGLESPRYTFRAVETDGHHHNLRVGDLDPSGTRYYALVNDFALVAVVPKDDLEGLLRWFDAPPYASRD